MPASLKRLGIAAGARRVQPTIAAARVLRARRLANGYLAVRARELGEPFERLPRGVPSLHDVGRGCVFDGLQFDDQLTPHYDARMPGNDLLYRWLATQDTTLPGDERHEAYPYRAR
jgi:hypothetical protein